MIKVSEWLCDLHYKRYASRVEQEKDAFGGIFSYTRY